MNTPPTSKIAASKAEKESLAARQLKLASLPIKGFIDSYDSGLFTGWAYNPNLPEEAVKVQLFVGQELIAEGMADNFRADLIAAGIGDGKHGFELPLLKRITAGEAHRVSMVCNESAPLNDIDFEFSLESEWEANLQHIDSSWLVGSCTFNNSSQSPDSVGFSVIIDNKKVGEGRAQKEGDTNRFPLHYHLPHQYFDGMPHLITVTISGKEVCQASIVEILRPILTPWQYLANNPQATERFYGGLPSMVARRLSSFQACVGMAASKGNGKAVQNIWQALQVLNEGHENRKKYTTTLTLPKVSEPDVTIIIPVHNKFELTYHCIASLILSENQCSYEVIVIDDCSTDKTTEINEVINNVKVIVNKTNLGFLRNCNKAAEVAKGRHIVLLNNDTEVGNRWLDEMLDVYKRFDKIGAVGAKLTYPNGTLQEAGGIIWDNGEPWNLGREGNPFDPQWNYVRQSDYLTGAALMVTTAIWKEVGGLSDEFAPAYYEDTDLAFKIRAAGYRTVYTPHAEVIHFEGMSHGKDTNSGFKKYQAINTPKFCAKWGAEFSHNGRVGTELWRHKDRGIRYRALVIDYATPEPDKNAGAYAAVQEMRLLQAHGFKLTFVPENLAHFGQYTVALQKMGIECPHAPFINTIESLLQKRGHEFDLVFITRYDVADRYIDLIRQHTRAKVLFNNADLHFLRELRMALANKETNLSGPLATRDRELALMRKVDAILSYNEAEHAVIASHNLRDDNIFKCPWVLNTRGHKTPFEKRQGIAFLGGYRHTPNIEAVEFFVNKVMPLVRASGKNIKFHIYGSHPPESFKKLESDDVILEGYIESLDDIFETCRIFVAPLLSGAGIKGKVLDAMSYGVPSVLSPVAAEATGLTHGASTLIADKPEDWAKAIIALYENPIQWKKFSENNLALARENYSFENGWQQFGKALGYLGLFGGKADSYMVMKDTA